MSNPADRFVPTDTPGSLPADHVDAALPAPARLLDDRVVNVGVDEAVAALDRAELEEASVVGGLDTPARRALLERRRADLLGLRAAVKVKLNAERAIRAAGRDVLLAGAYPPARRRRRYGPPRPLKPAARCASVCWATWD